MDKCCISMDRLLFGRNKAIIDVGKIVLLILCQNESRAKRESLP
jgi:hypothetical protein